MPDVTIAPSPSTDKMKKKLYKLFHYSHHVVFAPLATVRLLSSTRVHPAHRLSLIGKLVLGMRMMRNNTRIPSGSLYKVHLAMALKLLEASPDQAGDVVECGCWKGASSANLSLVCRIVGRKLKIYDSFEGLPAGKPGDREAPKYREGDYAGTLDEVRANITRYGAIECCELIKGWFSDTLPKHDTPIVLAFIDVDLEDSLDTCVRHLWPHLVEDGYLFSDECTNLDYAALFYSEKWWREHFDRTPPGLIGAGTGLPLGNFYVGPIDQIDSHFFQYASSGAYTRKSMSGYWSYYPERAG